MEIKRDVVAFISLVFLLLGALFGVQIMAFIFGNIDATVDESFADTTATTTNQSGSFINQTTFTIPEASTRAFNGGFAVTTAVNVTSNQVILSGNFTVDATAGTIINATATEWDAVNLTYTFSRRTDAELLINDVGNNSLVSIQSYSEQANTQMNTVGIAITLLILIALFGIFWAIFIKGSLGGMKKNGKFG